jgi:hypothetical protein
MFPVLYLSVITGIFVLNMTPGFLCALYSGLHDKLICRLMGLVNPADHEVAYDTSHSFMQFPLALGFKLLCSVNIFVCVNRIYVGRLFWRVYVKYFRNVCVDYAVF